MFEEIQGNSKKPIRDFFRVVSGLFIIAIVFNLFLTRGEPNPTTYNLLASLSVCVLLAIFLNVKMVTQIRVDGIYVKFFPFQNRFEKYSWDKISEIYFRNFDALIEYGGWGIRIGVNGKSYIVIGNVGIQLILDDGSKVLIGTQKPDELKQSLSQLGKV